MNKYKSPNPKKVNGKFVTTCPLCDKHIISITALEGNSNMNRHYLYKHSDLEDLENE